METKTNVMRVLDALKLPYRAFAYDADTALSGTEVAQTLSLNPERVFKTLVTVGKTRKYYVFMIPVALELNLKKAAQACGEKSIEMIKARELLPLTGYVHGGCSPIGMKKQFPTVAHETARDFETILFSAGKIGWQIEAGLNDLQKAVPVQLADVIVEH